MHRVNAPFVTVALPGTMCCKNTVVHSIQYHYPHYQRQHHHHRLCLSESVYRCFLLCLYVCVWVGASVCVCACLRVSVCVWVRTHTHKQAHTDLDKCVCLLPNFLSGETLPLLHHVRYEKICFWYFCLTLQQKHQVIFDTTVFCVYTYVCVLLHISYFAPSRQEPRA